MDSSGIKNQSKFQPLRELSPTALGSLHLKNRNLEELDQLAQKSVQRRLKSIETFKTEPISIDQPKEVFHVKKTKQPSLPYLPKKQKEYYNKWYIPYDQRYVQKPDQIEQHYEDELHFYKNMHKMYVHYNPFEEKIPEELQKNIGYKERTDAVKEILKGQKQIIEFKKSLDRERVRVPEFIKQLLEGEQKNKKYKQQNS